MPGYFHFHFSISRLPKNQVTQLPAIIKNQVGIDTVVNISIAAQDIKPTVIIMAIHCLTQALGSLLLLVAMFITFFYSEFGAPLSLYQKQL